MITFSLLDIENDNRPHFCIHLSHTLLIRFAHLFRTVHTLEEFSEICKLFFLLPKYFFILRFTSFVRLIYELG
jgi:hypothetical protein